MKIYRLYIIYRYLLCGVYMGCSINSINESKISQDAPTTVSPNRSILTGRPSCKHPLCVAMQPLLNLDINNVVSMYSYVDWLRVCLASRNHNIYKKVVIVKKNRLCDVVMWWTLLWNKNTVLFFSSLIVLQYIIVGMIEKGYFPRYTPTNVLITIVLRVSCESWLVG